MSKVILTEQDIIRHSASSELNCPLFWYQNRLMRSRTPYMRYTFDKILSSNISTIQSAVETEFMLNFATTDGYRHTMPVYEHKVYTHRVRVQELPATQVKEFVSEICKLNAQLLEHDLIARDVHESNAVLTIDGIKWLDYGAIVEASPDSCTTSFVLCCYLVNKYILKKIKCNAYETCLDDVKKGGDIFAVLADRDFTKASSWLETAGAIENLPVELDKSHWSENYSNTMDIAHPETLGDKGKNVAAILEELDFETVTDVACNKGFYSFLAAKKAKSVIGFDLIPACIEIARTFNKQFKLPAIFGAKTIESVRDNKAFETIRYRSDLVMALAIVHHIRDVISQADFVKTLLSISNKYILIEDIDQVAIYEKLFLEQGCELVKRVNSTPSPRTLSLYKKL